MNKGRPVKFPVHLSESEMTKFTEYRNLKSCVTIENRRRAIIGLNNYGTDGLNNTHIANANNFSKSFVTNTAKMYNNGGIEAIHTIARNPNSDTARLRLDARAEGYLISLACTPPPSPYVRWTITLCQEELNKIMLQKGLPGNFSRTSVWRALDRNELKPHKSEYWCIPEITSDFILRMERVLHLYSLPYDKEYPVVCMDELALQVLTDLKDRLNTANGCTEKLDYEYQRLGTKNIFVFIEPKIGRYYVKATDSRTAVDWALEIKHLVTNLYADAKKVILVIDNLNTHIIQSLYKAFPPEEARSIVERIHICYTPKHGSWLNVAEIAINIIKRQCIGKRFRNPDDAVALPERLSEWQDIKNAEAKPIKWNFTVEKAREKSHLYNMDLTDYSSSSTSKFYLLNARNDSSQEDNYPVRNSLVDLSYREDDNIIDLCRSIDENGNEYWSVSFEEKRISFREQIGKRKIAKIVHQRNTADGWRIPYPTVSRLYLEEDDKEPEIKYDFDFMALGEDIVSMYNLPYDKENPVICLRMKHYDEKNLENNKWICNLRPDIKLKKNDTEFESTQMNNGNEDSIQLHNQEKDTGLSFTLMFEPHTGKKYYRISDKNDDNNIPECLQDLVDNRYPEAKVIHLIVCEDDFEKIPFLEKRYTADEALRIYLKFEIHKVPNSAFWLNFAENESIVIGRRCISDGVNTAKELADQLVNWKKEKSCIKFNLDLKSFRRVFSNVYKPLDKYTS